MPCPTHSRDLRLRVLQLDLYGTPKAWVSI